MIEPSVPSVVTVPPVVVEPPVDIEEPSALTAALVTGPKYPAAGVIPLAAWKAATAAFVCPPKYPVAPAGIEYPLLISHVWRAVTSAPLLPRVRLRVNVSALAAPATVATSASPLTTPAIVFVNLLISN